MKTIKLDGVKRATFWEKEDKKRIYFRLDGVSDYQHKQGMFYAEYVRGHWFYAISLQKHVANIENLSGLTWKQAKSALSYLDLPLTLQRG